MMNKSLNREELAELLREAERAHGEHQKRLGRRDENWSEWYANYILRRLGEKNKESESNS